MPIQKRLSLHELIEPSGRGESVTTSDLFSIAERSFPKHYLAVWPADGSPTPGELPPLLAGDMDSLDTLYADVATFFPDYSPISAYCNIVDETTARRLLSDGATGSPFRQNAWSHDAMWGMLSVAESLTAAYLSGGTEDLITYSACRRSLSFCLGRAPHLPLRASGEEIASRWIQLRQLTGLETGVCSPTLTYLFEVFSEGGRGAAQNSLVWNLRSAFNGTGSLLSFRDELYSTLEISKSAKRLQGDFDSRIVAYQELCELVLARSPSREITAMALGLLTNELLPGSFSHTRLLKRHLHETPNCIIWYSVFCAMSEGFAAQKQFSGLVRKLIRDFSASFDALSAPKTDISLDELVVLTRVGLSTHQVKPTQSRVMAVSLFPGIDVSARFSERGEPPLREPATEQAALPVDAFRDAKLLSLLKAMEELIAGRGAPEPEAPPPKRTRRRKAP